jgi:hypothetical protein
MAWVMATAAAGKRLVSFRIGELLVQSPSVSLLTLGLQTRSKPRLKRNDRD